MLYCKAFCEFLFRTVFDKDYLRLPYVANAKFSLLKLLIYEPYYLCLSRLECQA